MEDADQPARKPICAAGTVVIAENGQRLGTVRVAYPHYVLVSEDDAPERDLEVPARAVARLENGKLYLSVNREALSDVDDEETDARQHPERT
jgi:hypothetical protein